MKDLSAATTIEEVLAYLLDTYDIVAAQVGAPMPADGFNAALHRVAEISRRQPDVAVMEILASKKFGSDKYFSKDVAETTRNWYRKAAKEFLATAQAPAE